MNTMKDHIINDDGDMRGYYFRDYQEKRGKGAGYLHDSMRGYGGKPPDIHQSSEKWNKWAKEEGKRDTAAYHEHLKKGGEKAYDVESTSTPGKTYRVWGEKGDMKCSCPSFKYRNTCKHVQAMGNEAPKRQLKYGRSFYYSK